jgi:penicillin-binding protein 1A
LADSKEIKAGPVTMTLVSYDENNPLEAVVKMSPLDSIKYHRMFLQVGMLAVDPNTGKVKAWVGGVNHKYFKYDHIRINRQVGSTFKPFVYATAIAQQGFSPCFQVYDLPVTISPGDGNFTLGEEWTPRNSDGKYTGALLTLKEGLAKSKNTVSARLMKELGDTEPVRDLVHQMGIDKYTRYPNGRYRVPKAPSICLGSTDLSVMEMTGAYTTFANNGTFNKPRFLLRIEDKNGRIIYDNSMPDERNALNPNANFVMLEMLKYAGGGALWDVKSEVGGKTGTTNDYVDGWYMGVTPNLVVGTWSGGEDRWIRFLDLTFGQGAYMAKPFFREFMKRLENDKDLNWDTEATFYRPPGDIGIELNCDEYENPGLELESEEFDEEFSDDPFGDEQEGSADDGSGM